MPGIDNIANADMDVVKQIIMAMRRYELKFQRHDRLRSFSELKKLNKDFVDLSEIARSQQVAQPAETSGNAENINVRISDLIKKLAALQSSAGGQAQSQAVEVTYQQEVRTEVSMKLEVYEHVDGLVVRNQHLAETDLYKFEFLDGSTFKITDKSTGKSTTIWGDPHVDTSDEQGTSNGDFKDLQDSKTQTSFMLRDNTRVTFTARDEGLIQKVDIFKGSQHLGGTGAEYEGFDPETGLFASKVDDSAANFISSVPVGDVVYAGGDGNDWYDSSHQLVWGKTTGPLAGARPDSRFEYSFQQTITEQLTVKSVNMLG